MRPFRRSRRRPALRRPAGLLMAVALLAGALVSLPGAGAGAATSRTFETRNVWITVRDGVRLLGHLSEPAAPGPHPLVVVPDTFAGSTLGSSRVADRLAARGYVALSYLERGIGDSGGLIDGGGPKDIADVSEVIDWALAHTDADASRIGAAGLSYGGGISLQAAAFDRRITVVANLSGWVDLERALFQNNTRAQASLTGLQLASALFGRLGPEAEQALGIGIAAGDPTPALEWARARSARTHLDRYRQHAPPLFMSHSMNETLAPIDATREFYEAYPGPKHWDLRAGDHGTHELIDIAGILPETWAEAFRWLDAWLLDADNGIRDEPPVLVVPRSSGGKRPVERYRDTDVRRTERRYLRSSKGLFLDTSSLTALPGTGSKTLREGQNWLLHVPIPEYSYVGETYLGRPLSAPLALIDRSQTGVWVGRRSPRTVNLRGETAIHLEITPTAARGTVVVFVLDVDLTGTGFIIQQVPWSFSGATPGKPLTVDVRAPYNAYDLTEGHALALAVSTGDPTYRSENPKGSRLTIGPGSWVDVPRR